MPIRLPLTTTILTSDFQDQAYSFAVESVIMQDGLLTVSAPKGYLLTSSLDQALKREQIVKHSQQTDSHWLASVTITMQATGNSLVDGVIIIRNSLNETLLLTIDATADSLLPVQKPALTLSQSTLVFLPTSPDKPSFQVLTITQQQGEAPVTLTTDAPEYFQLASDHRPAFSPALTLTPSALGTYVHIRYAASKTGGHAGLLTVRSQSETRTVTLEGRSAGLLPAFRQPALRPPARPVITKQGIRLLAFVFAAGLGYAGYSNRCQLIPALCQEPQISQFSTPAKELLPALSHGSTVSEKVAINAVVTGRVREKPSRLSEQSDQNRMPFYAPVAKQTTSDKFDQEPASAAAQSESPQKSIRQANDRQPDGQNPQRITPATSTDESELERMLNQKP